MHISEGVLSAPVLLTGAGLTVVGLTIALKKMDYDRLPQVAVMSAAFFVASLIHVPLGPSSVHLILNGIIGLVLGWSAIPAIFIALLLQAVLFQFGGIIVLGVNTVTMALPAVLVWMVFGPLIRRTDRVALPAAYAAGFVSVFLSGILVALALWSSGEEFFPIAKLILAAHLPIMIIEGFIAVGAIEFIKKTKPEMLS